MKQGLKKLARKFLNMMKGFDLCNHEINQIINYKLQNVGIRNNKKRNRVVKKQHTFTACCIQIRPH